MWSLLVLATGVLVLNLPAGYWRTSSRKFSWRWFLAVHAPVPLTLALRLALGVEFRWNTLPLTVGAYAAGQFLGGRIRSRQARRARNTCFPPE